MWNKIFFLIISILGNFVDENKISGQLTDDFEIDSYYDLEKDFNETAINSYDLKEELNITTINLDSNRAYEHDYNYNGYKNTLNFSKVYDREKNTVDKFQKAKQIMKELLYHFNLQLEDIKKKYFQIKETLLAMDNVLPNETEKMSEKWHYHDLMEVIDVGEGNYLIIGIIGYILGIYLTILWQYWNYIWLPLNGNE